MVRVELCGIVICVLPYKSFVNKSEFGFLFLHLIVEQPNLQTTLLRSNLDPHISQYDVSYIITC